MESHTMIVGDFLTTLRDTTRDVLPIILVIFGFQYFVLRQKIRNIKKILIGLAYVIVGLTLFLVGLEKALFPIGELMARQLHAKSIWLLSLGLATSICKTTKKNTSYRYFLLQEGLNSFRSIPIYAHRTWVAKRTGPVE